MAKENVAATINEYNYLDFLTKRNEISNEISKKIAKNYSEGFFTDVKAQA